MSLENLTEDEQSFADSLTAQGIPTTEDEFNAKFESMAADEGLTFQNTSGTSAWWNWLRAIAVTPMTWLVEFLILTVLPGLFLKTATGSYLDFHGWRLGLDRKEASKTIGNIKFSRTAVGTTLTVPAGTIIQTASINGNVYQVATTGDGEFSTNDDELVIPVEAAETGSAYNLAANYFVVMPSPISGISSVTNDSDWITTPGSDEEDDETYRARLQGRSSSNCDWHINTVYKTLISEFAGIDYERIYIDETEAPRGAGSADGLILFDAGVPSETYIEEINAYVTDQGYHGLGDDFQVKAMPETSHDLTLTIWVAKGMPDDDKTALQANVEQMIRCAWRENTDYELTQTWPYSLFSFGRLTSEIISRYSSVQSIEWSNSDFTNGAEICRIGTLTSTVSEVAY